MDLHAPTWTGGLQPTKIGRIHARTDRVTYCGKSAVVVEVGLGARLFATHDSDARELGVAADTSLKVVEHISSFHPQRARGLRDPPAAVRHVDRPRERVRLRLRSAGSKRDHKEWTAMDVLDGINLSTTKLYEKKDVTSQLDQNRQAENVHHLWSGRCWRSQQLIQPRTFLRNEFGTREGA
jgi:hypothetical protein